ncbi:MAG: hypothetical protein HC881_09820 [Leptolyngbyaceae cyanobacterium SL_7_1]|nr:hypothetical protein [Leptolyngbyaceae cyanobacterium SL_7_1]
MTHIANWFRGLRTGLKQFTNVFRAPVVSDVISKASDYVPVPGNFAVVLYDTRGNNATELGRYDNSAKAVARADLAGVYSAVVFDIDYKVLFYFNEGAGLQTFLAVGTEPKELITYIAAGGLLNPPPNLEKILEFAKQQGYWYDTYEDLNRYGEEITKRLNQLIGGRQ